MHADSIGRRSGRTSSWPNTEHTFGFSCEAVASELRGIEWAQSEKGSFVDTNPHSFNERVVASLCHDIRNVNHDRDYRSLCIFLGDYIESQQVALRVFDILRPGTGDTSLQVNVIGNMTVGKNHGFADLLAAGGHMRWLRHDGETFPAALRDWLDSFHDFVTVFHWIDIEEVSDCDKGDFDHSPSLSCRLCRRKEKTLVPPITFPNATKMTNTFPTSLVLDGRKTGGYPRADAAKFGPPNAHFPIFDLEWRKTVGPSSLGETFFTQGERPFSVDSLREVSKRVTN